MRIVVLLIFAIGVPLGLLGAGMVLNNHVQNRAEHTALEDQGQRGEAVIVSRERNSGRRFSMSGRGIRSISHFITYRFDANSGNRGVISFDAALNGEDQDLDLTFQNLEFRLPATRAEYDAAENGGRRDIIFLPEQPDVVRLIREDGSFDRSSGIPWAILLVGLSGLSGLMFWQYKATGRTI